MSLNLKHGFVLPEVGDTDAEQTEIIQNNIRKIADHNHDGVNSASVKITESINLHDWFKDSSDPYGRFRVVLNVDSRQNLNNKFIVIRNAHGDTIHLDHVTNNTNKTVSIWSTVEDTLTVDLV